LDGTGLYYYNARYYDPTIGRFISADTIVPNPTHAQALNRYSYCLNNPLRYIDPSGHNGSEIDGWTSYDDGSGIHWYSTDNGVPGESIYFSDGAYVKWDADGMAHFIPADTIVIFCYYSEFYEDDYRSYYDFTESETRPAYALDPPNTETGFSFMGHLLLDIGGLVFDPCDWLNGIWYAAEGDEENAAWCGAGSVPVFGIFGTLGKWGRKAAKGFGNIGSHAVMDAGDALGHGVKWLGDGYTETAPGVFRSTDNMRQFRMTAGDLDPFGHGAKSGLGSHVHFEALDVNGNVIENLHIPITP